MSEQLLAYVEKESLFHRADALSKLFWVVIIVIATFQFQTTLTRALMFCVLLFTALILAKVPLSSMWRVSPLIFGVAFLLGAFHYVVTKGMTPLFNLGSYTVYREPLEAGGAYFFRLAIMVLASFLLIWTTDTYQLMVGLAYLGLPYRYAFAIFMALRYIPLIQREVEAVRAAHAIRGKAAQSPLKHRFRLWQRYLFTVIVNGLRKAENTAVAIEARGFGAYSERTYWKEFRWTRGGILLMICFAVFCVALIVWERCY